MDTGSSVTNNITLLIVDDDTAILRNLTMFFEDEGITVFPASSAEDGLAVVRERELDVSIVDMRLPGMDGNAFVLKAHSIRPDMKFIVYTGSVDYVLSRKMKTLGIHDEDIFMKPVENMDTLFRRVIELVSSPLP